MLYLLCCFIYFKAFLFIDCLLLFILIVMLQLNFWNQFHNYNAFEFMEYYNYIGWLYEIGFTNK